MRRSNKYYILRRIEKDTIDAFLCEFSGTIREQIEKRIDSKKPLILVEKTCTFIIKSGTFME